MLVRWGGALEIALWETVADLPKEPDRFVNEIEK